MREQLQALRLQRVYIYWRESVKLANPRKHLDQSKNPPETSSLMSEQANQLHNPPVMFNEREITFYTLLDSCDKHVVFFCVWESLGFQS